MDSKLFDDLMSSCEEALEYKKGNISIKTTTLEIADDEVDPCYLIYTKIAGMSEVNRQRVAGYVDGILQASG